MKKTTKNIGIEISREDLAKIAGSGNLFSDLTSEIRDILTFDINDSGGTMQINYGGNGLEVIFDFPFDGAESATDGVSITGDACSFQEGLKDYLNSSREDNDKLTDSDIQASWREALMEEYRAYWENKTGGSGVH